MGHPQFLLQPFNLVAFSGVWTKPLAAAVAIGQIPSTQGFLRHAQVLSDLSPWLAALARQPQRLLDELRRIPVPL